MTDTPKTRGKSRIVLAAVGIMVVVMLCLFVGRMRERKEFIASAVDGYRYRCTLSTDWKSSQEYPAYIEKISDLYYFIPSSSPIREWISSHLFPPQPAKGKSPTITTAIFMSTVTATVESPEVLIQRGYPEPTWGVRSHIVRERHLRIDSCSATVLKWEMANSGFSLHGTTLLVYQPESGNTYIVAGMAEPQGDDRVDREVEGIIESFHVEKVVPAGSK